MKKILKMYILILLLFSNYLSSKTLKIATSEDMLPYSFLNEDKELTGFFIDYWNLWSEKTGIKIEFIPSSWTQTLVNIKNKKADIHSGLFINSKRKQYVQYLNSIYNTTSSIYVLNKSNINTITELNGKTLAVIKGSFYKDYFMKNHPLIKIITYENYNEYKTDILKHKVDAFIDDDIISWMSIIRFFDYNKVKKIDNFSLRKSFYTGIIQDDVKLEKLVRDGMMKISLKDMKVLEKKWITNRELQHLSDIKENDILNVEERIYLKNNNDLKMAFVKGWKLMSFYDKNNEFSGFHVDLLEKINEKIDANIQYEVYDNWSKAYEDSKNTNINGIFGLSWTKEREKYFAYSSAYYHTPIYLIRRKNDTSINDIKNLINKTAVVPQNSVAIKILKRNSKIYILFMQKIK